MYWRRFKGLLGKKRTITPQIPESLHALLSSGDYSELPESEEAAGLLEQHVNDLKEVFMTHTMYKKGGKWGEIHNALVDEISIEIPDLSLEGKEFIDSPGAEYVKNGTLGR